MEQALPCIICGNGMKNVGGSDIRQPSGGLEFVTNGHYGSTVFDPMNGDKLKIAIHDECLTRAAKLGQVAFEPRDADGTNLKPWHPDK